MAPQVQARAGVIDDLAGELGRRAAGVRAVDLAGPLDAAASALPGSRTSSAAIAVGIRLAAAAQVVADRADEMAGAARATADSLSAVDARSASRMVMR
ncbi:hypothetical protein J4G33_13460 [Actinotalea sp. BY-33]|uniref:Uncharacterized protein n=1 Tax=Actinotalea soli TaxID=2819234 RepID=A0A939RVW5_9CELL|nr:hypothetical protein [Actinotalea soli]MBO1752815.1 hypothetical protein [Actinotalea soli]